jgi:hypothetical protein
MSGSSLAKTFKDWRFLPDFGMFLQIIMTLLATVKTGLRVQGSGINEQGNREQGIGNRKTESLRCGS